MEPTQSSSAEGVRSELTQKLPLVKQEFAVETQAKKSLVFKETLTTRDITQTLYNLTITIVMPRIQSQTT